MASKQHMCSGSTRAGPCLNPATKEFVSFAGGRSWVCDRHFAEYQEIESRWSWFQKWRYKRYLKSGQYQKDLQEMTDTAARHFDEWFPPEDQGTT